MENYMVSGDPVAQQRVYGKQPAYAPHMIGASPGCIDWSAYCGQGEFAEVYDLTFNPFETNTNAMAAGEIRDAVATITPEARFVAVKIVGDAKPLGRSYSFTIVDVGSQRELSSDYVWATNGLGTAQRPRELFIPRLFGAQGSIRLRIRNDDANTITSLQVVFQGFKILSEEKLNAGIRRCL